jgi:hypothetical protein
MTLLDAPKYDPAHDRKIRNLLIAAGVSIVLIAVIGVGGFFAGHGWFFDNLGIEHRVSTFLKAVQSNDLDRAYGIWLNDPEWKQHPQNPNYDFKRFSADWGPQSEDGPLRTYKVEISKRTGTGCIIQTQINDKPKRLFLWYQISTQKLSFSPLELSTL